MPARSVLGFHRWPIVVGFMASVGGCAAPMAPPTARDCEPCPDTARPSDQAAASVGPASMERDSAPLAISAAGQTKLPPPTTEGGMPLAQALALRRSARSFADKQLPAQLLSDLLWAATGVNRPDEGRLTAPSARNKQEIDVYVALEAGLFRYQPTAHGLEKVADRDVRAVTGKQGFVATAPANLVYVANLTKMSEGSGEDQLRYSAADTGFIAQNVYLFCASAGLATVVRGHIDRAALAEAMELGAEQRIVLAQTVGFPSPE